MVGFLMGWGIIWINSDGNRIIGNVFFWLMFLEKIYVFIIDIYFFVKKKFMGCFFFMLNRCIMCMCNILFFEFGKFIIKDNKSFIIFCFYVEMLFIRVYKFIIFVYSIVYYSIDFLF